MASLELKENRRLPLFEQMKKSVETIETRNRSAKPYVVNVRIETVLLIMHMPYLWKNIVLELPLG
jgi:hypothetical protein